MKSNPLNPSFTLPTSLPIILITLVFFLCGSAAAASSSAVDDPATDLAVTKTGPDQIPANSNVTYEITVTNNGPDQADNATMTDVLPTGLTFVSISAPAGWSCSTPGPGNAGTITCSNPSLAFSASASFTLVAHTDSAVLPGSFISNKATVTTTTPDTTDENDQSTASIQIAGGSTTDVGVSLQADKESALAGDNVVYAITVSSSTPADSISLADSLPAGMTFVSITFPTGWNCTHPSPGSGGNVNCTIPSLPPTPGQVFNLTVNISPNTADGTVFTNSITIATSTQDVNSENDAAATSTTVQANYVISTTAGSGQSAPINGAFPIQLQATVTLAGLPKSGVNVTFQAPGTGPSGSFNSEVSETVATDDNGIATSSTFTANAIVGGPYQVTATAAMSNSVFTLTNTKGSQTINFPSPGPKTYGDSPFILFAAASSDLPVSFSLVSGPATLNGATVTIIGPGTIIIRATQPGDNNYNAAAPVDQSIVVSKATPSVTVTTSKTPSEFGESITFTAVVGTANTSSPSGTVQFKDGSTNLSTPATCIAGGNVCTAQRSTLTLSSGSHTISASYQGDSNFNAATGTLAGGQVVKPQPSISIDDVSRSEGNNGTTAFDFTVTLSATSSLNVRVAYATANGTATLVNNDYRSTSGILTFSPGELTKTIPVLVNGDLNREPDESLFVNLNAPINATISKTQGVGVILNDDTLDPPQLILDESGPSPNQAAALDSLLFLRDPFLVRSPADWWDLGADRNTRVILFASNLQLNPGETAAAVIVSLVSISGQSFDITAEDVRQVPASGFTQIVFRLPDGLAPGDALVTLKAHGQFSNGAIIRIRQ